jgi:hypothetical protein
LNFDEFNEEGPDSDKYNSKTWSNLYDPEFSLLFNLKCFPEDLLQGDVVGDFCIHELHLFDRYLTP